MYNEIQLRSIINNATDGVIVIDITGKILLVNPSACSLFGYRVQELIGRNVSILSPAPENEPDDLYPVNYIEPGMTQIPGVSREVTALRKDGSVFQARFAVNEIELDDKHVFAGIVHDISREKAAGEIMIRENDRLRSLVDHKTKMLQKMMRSLAIAKKEADAALQKERELNQLKSRFVSIASHEFRTPLSSIQLSASLIEHYYDRLDKEKIFFHLEKINAGVNNLTAILNDFLSVERIEAGKTNPVYREFDLKTLCEGIADAMNSEARRGQKILYKHFGKTTRFYLDDNLLQHCLHNLVSNAIKYSHDGGTVCLNTRLTRTQCRIWVEDHGIGIPRESQAQLFEPFFRANNTMDIQGTGLGLNIVQRYTRLMNGEINFTSDDKTGTVFTIIFPVKAQALKLAI